MKTGKLYQAFGKEKTLLEWASDPMCRVPLKTLRNRIGRGCSIEDALTVTERRAGRYPKRYIEAFGERKAVREWERDQRCTVSYVTVWRRIQQGCSPELAITLPSWDTDIGIPAHENAPPRTEPIDLTRLTLGQREMYHTLLGEEKKGRRFYQGSAAEYYRLVTATDYTSASPLSPNYHMAS